MSNFQNIPKDTDTKILSEFELLFNGYNVLHQKWKWDGIYGESLIFKSSEVEKLSEEELINLVNTSPIVTKKTETNYKNSGDYIFINFNFISE